MKQTVIGRKNDVLTAKDGSVERTLHKIYTGLKNPGSLGGVQAVWREVKKKHSHISKKYVTDWLHNQATYTLHKPARKKYPTKKVVVGGIHLQLQADLADMQSLAKHNQNFRYILTVIDCFSRVAWAVPLKDKTGNTLVQAFRDYVLTDPKTLPVRIQVDKGTEFYNKGVKELMKKHNIDMFSTESPYKAQMVERFNRTLKEKLWKYMTLKQTSKWVDVLPDLLESYNTTPHSALPKNMAPMNVNVQNQSEVWWHLYGDYFFNKKLRRKPKFDLGDTVRISKVKRTFDKGYLPNYTEEIFVIESVLNTTPPSYRVKDYSGEIVEGIFYEQELTTAHDSGVYLVEEVVRRRGKGKNAELLVKWRGYPSSMNSWVAAATILPPTAAR